MKKRWLSFIITNHFLRWLSKRISTKCSIDSVLWDVAKKILSGRTKNCWSWKYIIINQRTRIFYKNVWDQIMLLTIYKATNKQIINSVLSKYEQYN